KSNNLIASSLNTSESNPNHGINAVHHQSSWEKTSIYTSSVSPGSAHFTYTGPATELTFPKSRFATSFLVEFFLNCPPEASVISYVIVCPESTSAMGLTELSQPIWLFDLKS